jgi:vacuolar-type H+-ATPase subunit I/STV1
LRYNPPVPKSSRKLDALAALLERTGGDPKRIEAVRRAQGFRRSWVDLAEILCQVRARNLHEKWGYSDFYEYAQDELTLKRGTVDKLTVSYNTLERHAPQVLQRDGVATKIPDYDALEYYHRTVGELEAVSPADEEAANDDPERPVRRGRVPQLPTPELRQEFEEAVFNEGQPLGELRRRFDQHFYPRPKGAEELDRIRKASATARKLAELLTEIEGLSEGLVRKLEAEIGKLRTELDELAEPIKDKVAKATARSNKKALKARAEFAEQLTRGETG